MRSLKQSEAVITSYRNGCSLYQSEDKDGVANKINKESELDEQHLFCRSNPIYTDENKDTVVTLGKRQAPEPTVKQFESENLTLCK